MSPHRGPPLRPCGALGWRWLRTDHWPRFALYQNVYIPGYVSDRIYVVYVLIQWVPMSTSGVRRRRLLCW